MRLEKSAGDGLGRVFKAVGRTFVLHTSPFMSLGREKLGLWKGDLAYIRIPRCVVYTRAGAGGFLSSFLKLHFQVVLDLQKGWGKAAVI